MQISLAPMEGITTYIFRNAIHRNFGDIDRFFTPFLTASHLKGREKRDVLPDNNTVPCLIPQILTNDAELFITITKQLEALGYKEVNLNLGCPSGTVTAKGRGAGFLDRLPELDSFLEYIFTHSPIRISIKTRIGFEFLSEWEDIADIYAKYPVSELIIHPRVGKEMYKGHAHTDIYVKMRDYLQDKMPETVFTYNGDIRSVEDLTSINEKINKSDNIMIGRGLIRDPSLAYKIKNGTEIPDYRKRFLAFHDELLSEYQEEMQYEDQVVKKMKELWCYLGDYPEISRKALKELLKSNSLITYKNRFTVLMSYI